METKSLFLLTWWLGLRLPGI